MVVVRPGPPVQAASPGTRTRLDAAGPGEEALLLVGHGSRRAAASDDLADLLDLVRAGLPGVAVAGGWIELADPPATEAGVALLDHVEAAGPALLVVQPLLFARAYHAREDLPAIVAEIRGRRPDVRVDRLAPFMVSRTLVDLAATRVLAALGDLRDDDAVVVVPSGTSDARAQDDAGLAARALARQLGVPRSRVRHAFASVATPDVAAAVTAAARDGARRVAVLSWSLFAGRLVDGVQRAAEDATDRAGVALAWAGRFGPDPAVADLVVRRHRAAVARARGPRRR